MSWRAFVDQVALRAGSSRAATRAVLAAFVDEVEDTLLFGEAVTVPGLGTITSHWEPERTLRSIKDGRKVAIDGRYRPTFRPAGRLRAAMRDRTPQLLKDPAHQRAWRLAETLVGDLALYHAAAAPKDLAEDTELSEVDTRCARALGPAWTRARRTLDEQTPPEVRAVRDHLALAARRRWAVRG